ncbi:MAG: type II toxin-antitoxin system YafQ family toxin [Spirochaetaceae bacterium]|jgi:mRNA interferase YafQ|nr:type II toxin-antitoxin system YafQ family toxin [Spirochaetaceae bacterium]
MLTLELTGKYRKDRNLAIRRGRNIALLDEVIEILQNEKPLDPKYQDHALKGRWSKLRECHIQGDWLLVYSVDKGRLILSLTRTGTHADFGW